MSDVFTPDPALGGWTSVTLPDDGEAKNVASVRVSLEALANKGSRYIDAFAGGTYAPASAIVIGGAGLDVQGPFDAANGADIAGGMNVTGTANFFDTVNFFGAFNTSGLTTLGGHTDVADGQTFEFLGVSTLLGGGGAALTWTGPATLAGTNTLSGPTSVTGNFTLTQPVATTGRGHVRSRRITGVNANHTYSIVNADVITIEVGGISGPVTYALDVADAVDGDVIEFLNMDPTFIATVNGLGLRTTSGQFYQARFIFNGTSWLLLSTSITA